MSIGTAIKSSSNPRQRFRELRKQKGTQRKVAEEMDLTETTVRSLEAGRVNPSLETAAAFADYFKTNVYDLWPDIFPSNQLRQITCKSCSQNVL